MAMLIFALSFRWVQTECRRLGDTDNPEVSELLRTAVRCLKERPVLFKYCAEEVITVESTSSAYMNVLSPHSNIHSSVHN